MGGGEGGEGDPLQVAGEGLEVLVQDEWVAVEVVPAVVVDGGVDFAGGEGGREGRREGGRGGGEDEDEAVAAGVVWDV